MRIRVASSFVLSLAAVLLLLLPGCGDSGDGDVRFVTIGTGGMTGVYYPTGGAISKMVNAKRAEYGLSCSVQSTGGSVFNVNAIAAGDMEFGIVQSDRQYQAVHGLAEWKDKGKQEDIRAVFSIHPETVTLVAADDAGISTIRDLVGKRVNIGNPGSGQRQNAIDALENAGIDWENDVQAESVRASEAPGLLQDDRIDAFFYTVGHPSGAIKEATAGVRKVHFVPLTDADDLIQRLPYYTRAKIHVRHYPSSTNKEDVETFGVKATLVASAKVPDDVVYAICREVFENLDAFKALHPAYADLTREKMLEGLTAPLHPGAMKYYREAGLKK